jgi:aspartyl-tRNA(Asn)/glutamyl-tRNA(Gln) amidotransferase subunit C
MPGAEPEHPVLTRDDVAHLAHLARLAVTDKELDRYVGQLSVILDAVAVVSEVVAGGAVATKWQAPGSGAPSEQSGTVSEVVAGGAVATKWQAPGSGAPSEQSDAVTEVARDDIEPTSHAVPLTNVYRKDAIVPGLSREQALAMAPAAEDGRFRVPQILGEEQ